MGWGENDRGVSFTFGAEVVSKFLHKHDFDLICRAHQVSLVAHMCICEGRVSRDGQIIFQCCGSGMFIPVFFFTSPIPGSRIPDSTTTKRGGGNSALRTGTSVEKIWANLQAFFTPETTLVANTVFWYIGELPPLSTTPVANLPAVSTTPDVPAVACLSLWLTSLYLVSCFCWHFCYCWRFCCCWDPAVVDILSFPGVSSIFDVPSVFDILNTAGVPFFFSTQCCC